MRGLLYVVVVVVVAIALSRMLQARRGTPLGTRRVQRDELVKDPVCQTYVVLSRAVRTEVNGVVTHFCSRECAARYVEEGRRR
jgi:YHS domain-containing protein